MRIRQVKLCRDEPNARFLPEHVNHSFDFDVPRHSFLSEFNSCPRNAIMFLTMFGE